MSSTEDIYKITHTHKLTPKSSFFIYLVCVQVAVHLEGLMVVQETHWTLWVAVCLQ